MKRKIFLILFALPLLSAAQINFGKYFLDKSMRFDFSLGGNSEEVQVYPEQIKQEAYWAGSKNNLIDSFNYGTYRFRVFDLESDNLIFLKGFSTLFQEWQTTPEAKEKNRSFYHAVIFPFPRKKVTLQIDARQWEGNFKTIYSAVIDPEDYFILKESPPAFEVINILNNGNHENKVDIVILAEGYTKEQMNKFIKDAGRVTEYLFKEEPFKSEKEKFNIKAVQTPSAESGADVPGENIYRNTAFNSSFYTFDVPRYLTTNDMKKIYDAASVVPWDQIYLLVNSERYGGGGFYNFISICTADDDLTQPVFVHEFGHGFAGLGDEYYTSSVAYEDYYNLNIEPWEPNLTTLINFDSKWKNMIHDSVPIPTPRKSKYAGITGAFEGGGYLHKEIYSPFMDCRMKSNNAEGFCPVCRESIKKIIHFHSQ